jgi:hypothetical protein
MNDLDEFAEVTVAIFVALTLLIWLLTHLEQTLLDAAAADRRNRRKRRPRQSSASSDEPPNDRVGQ